MSSTTATLASTSRPMTIVKLDRPVSLPWGMLYLAIAKPAKWSKMSAVTLSGNATANRKLLGV